MNNLKKGLFLLSITFSAIVTAQAEKSKNPSSAKSEYKKLQFHVDEFNKISAQYNQSQDKNKIDQLITNLENFTERKMSFIEKKFIQAEFSLMEKMPLLELSPKEIKFYDQNDFKKETILTMQIVDAEKNLFKYNNMTFELNPSKPIQDNLKILINGLNTASN